MWTSILAAALAATAATGTGGPWVVPMPIDSGQLLRSFERPEHRFAPGHRGVDLRAQAGTRVRAIGAGTVAFVGDVAGVPTITIDHASVRSTYLPIAAMVEVGEQVTVGQVIGTITARGRHCSRDCLHLGIRRTEPLGAETDPYLDPLAWIRGIPVLKPLAGRVR